MNKDSENINESDSKKANEPLDFFSNNENIDGDNIDCNQNNVNIDIDKIIKDLQYYEKLKATIIEMQKTSENSSSCSNSEISSSDHNCPCDDLETIMNKTNETLILIDSIKTQICRLPLNPCPREYFNLYVFPLLTTLDMLSRSSYNLGTSSALISDSKTLCVNTLELQKNLNLIYCINRKCAELYCALEKNVDSLICRTITTN